MLETVGWLLLGVAYLACSAGAVWQLVDSNRNGDGRFVRALLFSTAVATCLAAFSIAQVWF